MESLPGRSQLAWPQARAELVVASKLFPSVTWVAVALMQRMPVPRAATSMRAANRGSTKYLRRMHYLLVMSERYGDYDLWVATVKAEGVRGRYRSGYWG